MTERRSKYNARPTVEGGIRFDSQAEARRYGELRLLQVAGEIMNLEVHPHYPLVVNSEKVGEFVADFSYREKGKVVVEDVKGVRTPLYRIKAKLMHALYQITVKEVSLEAIR